MGILAQAAGAVGLSNAVEYTGRSDTWGNGCWGLYFRPDGLGFYFVDDTGVDSLTVVGVELATPWDFLDTVTGSLQSFYVGDDFASVQGLTFSEDGTNLYVCGDGVSVANIIVQYTLPSFDLNSPLGVTKVAELNVSAETFIPSALAISPDETRLFVVGNTSARAILQYNLSTPGSLSTATYSGNSIDVSADASPPRGLTISPDGKKLVIMDSGSPDRMLMYRLSTAFDASTGSLVKTHTITESTAPSGVTFFGEYGMGLLVMDVTAGELFEYRLPSPYSL